MSLFDRTPKPATTTAARKIFESQALDGEITVASADYDLLQQHFAAASARFPGANYLEWLKFFHHFVEPVNYLEIGVETGASLAFAQPPTLAVGVDPSLALKHEQKARNKLFHLTSDEFFAAQNMKEVFEGEPIYLAFIDGLHTFDQALKDFLNVERHAARHSIILFHDIFPVAAVCAARKRESVFWCGDTWKVICLLKKHRPDLKIFTIPTYPSGLTVVTNVNPESTLLTDQYDALVAEGMAYQYEAYAPEMGKHLNETPNDFQNVIAILNG